MPRLQSVYLSAGDVPAVRFRLRDIERQIVLAPQDQQARLRLVRLLLPSRIGRHIRTIVIEEVTLAIGLPSTAEEGEFVGPQIEIVPFHREVRADMSSARDGRDSRFPAAPIRAPRGPPKTLVWPSNLLPAPHCGPRRPEQSAHPHAQDGLMPCETRPDPRGPACRSRSASAAAPR